MPISFVYEGATIGLFDFFKGISKNPFLSKNEGNE